MVAAEGIIKSFGRSRALNGLNLTVNAGEVHGFLGPNGAGKSTTIRVLLGLMRADGGSASLLGGDPWKDATELHRRIAYVPGDVTLWPQLSGGEVIDLLGRIGSGLDPDRRKTLLERYELDPTKKARTYSKGNRQKVALVAAFASKAELLIFDEPTSGLDPLMEEIFRQCVTEVRAEGRTVLLSSHILSEVEALCDQVTIIRSGTTVESGALSSLRHLGRTTVVAEVDTVPAGLDSLPGVHNVTVEANTVRFQAENGHLSDAVGRLAAAGLRSLTSAAPTLEELFLRYYSTAQDHSEPKQAVRS
jgi:ABC-2 type transport system ATP-binding protein